MTATTQNQLPRKGGWKPAIMLMILAPLVGEVFFGAVRLSSFPILIPLILKWGGAALLIRYLAHRYGLGWHGMLLLGLGLAVAEECLIVQTSLAPLVGMDPDQIYSRMGGVNWVYLLWGLGYESVWIILLSIQLTELLFRHRREELWIGRTGFVVVLILFILACLMTWYGWTKVFVPQYFPASVYQPPLHALVIAAAISAAFIVAAFKLRAPNHRAFPSMASSAKMGWLGFTLATVWCGLVLVGYGGFPGLHPAIPLLLAPAYAAACYMLVARWSAHASFGDKHRACLVLGGSAGSMLIGFAMLAAAGVPVVSLDFIGKLVLNLLALSWFGWFIRKKLKD
jgi:hypothetical protein